MKFTACAASVVVGSLQLLLLAVVANAGELKTANHLADYYKGPVYVAPLYRWSTVVQTALPGGSYEYTVLDGAGDAAAVEAASSEVGHGNNCILLHIIQRSSIAIVNHSAIIK